MLIVVVDIKLLILLTVQTESTKKVLKLYF